MSNPRTEPGQDAAAEQEQRKPDKPTDLNKQSWKYGLRRALKEFSDDQCTDLAAALTYYAVLSLFPAVLAMVSLVGIVGQGPRATDALLKIVARHRAAVRRGGGPRTAAVDQPLHRRGAHPGARPADRPVVGLRLRRRVRAGDEPDLRDR